MRLAATEERRKQRTKKVMEEVVSDRHTHRLPLNFLFVLLLGSIVLGSNRRILVSNGIFEEFKKKDGPQSQIVSVVRNMTDKVSNWRDKSWNYLHNEILRPHYIDAVPVQDSFSACLLVKDENHRLNEWIAYHYFTMNLRYLIVVVDPGSQTPPTETLERWRKRENLKLTIIEWGDEDVIRQLNINMSTFKDRLWWDHTHIVRQEHTYHACSLHMTEQNRTWTSYHDVDEYIHIISDVYQPGGSWKALELQGQQGSVMKLVQKYSQSNKTSDLEKDRWYSHFQHSACVTIPRTLYGSTESTEEEVDLAVPGIFVGKKLARRFETMRWRYRTADRFGDSIDADNIGKSIIDASRVKPYDYSEGIHTHVPLKKICPERWLVYEYLPLGIAHYHGSWEAYNFKVDVRRTRKKWEEKAFLKEGGADDSLRPWLSGFFNLVGGREAYYLLHDTGLPSSDYAEVPDYGKKTTSLVNKKEYPPLEVNFNETFSACLYVNDDQHHHLMLLNEWIAYHYFTLNLRYLMVSVAGAKTELISDALNRWNKPKWNMTLVHVSEKGISSFLKISNIASYAKHDNTRLSLKKLDFYRMCSLQMIAQNRTWTSYVDTNEFITINRNVYQPGGPVQANSIMHQHGSILGLIQKYKNANMTDLRESKEHEFWFRHFQNGPCITIGRSIFGAVESSDKLISSYVPANFAAHNMSRMFATMRWRYRINSGTSKGDRASALTLSKSIIDMSRVAWQDVLEEMSLYKPLRSICPVSSLTYDELPIGINYYAGILNAPGMTKTAREKMSHKNARIDQEMWEQMLLMNSGRKMEDDSVRPWLAGFVDMVGENAAFHLLYDVGRPIEATD